MSITLWELKDTGTDLTKFSFSDKKNLEDFDVEFIEDEIRTLKLMQKAKEGIS